MSGKVGRTWSMSVVDDAVVAKVRVLADSWQSSRKLADAIGMRRATIDNARVGKPLAPATWRRLDHAISQVPRVPPVDFVGRIVKSLVKLSSVCVVCKVHRVHQSKADDAPRDTCHHCLRGEEVPRTSECPHCGHEHRDSLSAAVCCLIVPEVDGWCAWCGQDSERPYCGKACSISLHADASRDLLGEGMGGGSVMADGCSRRF